MSLPLRALLFRRPSELSTISIAFEREVYLVRVRRHRQARRYTLRIHSATRDVVLTMPPRGSLTQAREFAQKHGAWIAARLQRLPAPAGARFSQGGGARRVGKAAGRRAAAALAVSIKRVSVRDQSSRWGSCSTAGGLSYSWRLVPGPALLLAFLLP